jgi:tetratricopeptide (TPR) repeat protein
MRRVSQSLPHNGYEKVRFRARLNEGVVLLLLGEIPLARAAFVETLNSAFTPSPLHMCLSLNNLGHTFRMQGDTPRALEYYDQARQSAVAHHLDRQHCISLFWIGQVALDSGNLSEAEISLDEAERIAARMKHGGLRQEVLRRRAELLWKLGKRRLARQLLSRAMQLKKTLKQPRDLALLRRTELMVAPGVVSNQDMQELVRDFRGTGDRYEFTQTILLLFEHLVRDRHRHGWLADVEKEARYYIATIGRSEWQDRLDAALLSLTPWPTTMEDFQRNRKAFERSEIEAALSQVAGVANSAAALLGIGRNTLAQKIKEHGIDRRFYRKRARGTRSNSPEGFTPGSGRSLRRSPD